MGKKYIVFEVDEPSPSYDDCDYEGPWIIFPFLLLPPILSIYSMVTVREEGEFCETATAFTASIVDMIITLATTIGLFFGVSYLSALIPFIFFLWSGANLLHVFLGDMRNEVVKDFYEDTRIDIALFFLILFLAIGGITEIGFALQPAGTVTDRATANLVWLICVVFTLHISAIFLFAYLNDNYIGEDASVFLHIGLTILYLSPALFYIGLAVAYINAPMAVVSLLEPIGVNQFSVYFVLSVSAAFMIAEGIILIVGHGDGCAKYGILQGILSIVFAAFAIVSVALSLNIAPPAVLHIKNVSDWNKSGAINLLGERGIHYYLDDDIDFNGEQIFKISIRENEMFDGKGHKLINGVSVGKYSSSGFFQGNEGVIKNLTLDHCIVYLYFSSGRMGAFVGINDGTIENCHAIETNIYFESSLSYCPRYPDLFIGGIAGVNYGTVKNCSFENSDLNAAFPYSILHPSWATFSEIANIGKGATIEGCYFVGTHGEGVADFDPEG